MEWIIASEETSSISLISKESVDELRFDLPEGIAYLSETDGFCFCLFEKRNVLENDIRIVRTKVDDNIAGWLIPLSALESVDHSKAQDTHYQQAGSIAVSLIFESLVRDQSTILKKTAPGFCKLTELLHDSCVVFVYNKKVIPWFEDIPINSSLFYLQGYFRREVNNLGSVRCIAPVDAGDKEIIKLGRPSEAIDNQQIIHSLLNYSFAEEESPVLKFFFLYQIVELLIQQVLGEEYSIFLADIAESGLSVKQLQKKIKNRMEGDGQGKRVVKLFNQYSQVSKEATDYLSSSVKNFLDCIEKGESGSDDIFGALYEVRNCIFHDFGGIQWKVSDEIINDLVNATLSILDDVLKTFDPKLRQHS